MERIAQQIKQAIATGQVPDNLKQMYDFQMYLAAKKIMRLPKEKRAAVFATLPEHTKPVIKKWANITNRYFTDHQ